MAILLLGTNQIGRWNWVHEHEKQAMLRHFGGKAYGPDYPGWNPLLRDVDQIIGWAGFVPDLIVSFMGKYSKWARGLEKTSIPKVHIVTDYFPWNYGEENEFLSHNRIDLALANFGHEVQSLRGHGFEAEHLPLSINPQVFYDRGRGRDIEVTAVMSLVSWAYPTRSKAMQALAELPYKSFLRGAGPGKYVWQQDYVDLLNRSQIMVNAVDKCRSLNYKFLEACACGAMLLTESADDAELMGFVEEENYVTFSGTRDLQAKVRHYLSHPEERERIARAGQQLVMERHTGPRRAQEMQATITQWMKQKSERRS